MKKELVKLAALGACFCLAGTASALQTYEPLNVTASVEQICTASATPLAFGAYSELNGNNASSVLTLNCSQGTMFKIALDSGPNFNGSSRGMYGTNYWQILEYELYNPITGDLWGDDGMTHPGLSYLDTTAMAGPLDYVIDGNIPPGQTVPADSYSDWVTIIVSY